MWSIRSVIEAIQLYHAKYGVPPKSTTWSKARPNQPSTKTVQKVCGSWNAAIEAAGFEPARRTVDPKAYGVNALDFCAGPPFPSPAGYAKHQRLGTEACTVCKQSRLLYLETLRQREHPTWVHGTTTGYNSYGCRCRKCRDAIAAHCRHSRQRRASQRKSEEGSHGPTQS